MDGNYPSSAPSNPEEQPTTPGANSSSLPGFEKFANSPTEIMGFYGQGYRPFSPPDSQGFARFSTRHEDQHLSRFSTQGLESMNLVLPFDSVSNVRQEAPNKGFVRGKGKAKATPAGPPTTQSQTKKPVKYSEDETECLAHIWAAISQDPRMGDDQTSNHFWKWIEAF